MIKLCVRLIGLLGAITVGISTQIFAAEVAGREPTAGISIAEAWARATPGVSTIGAAYLTIKGDPKTDDKLVSVEATAARKSELHTHTTDNGVMRMRRKKFVAIPAGKTVVLKPGGDHVMLFELKRPLKVGTKFNLTLHFEKAGKVSTSIKVLKIGSMGPGKMGPGKMGPGARGSN